MPDSIMRTMADLASELQEPIRNYYGNDGLGQARARLRVADEFQAALGRATDQAVQYVTGSLVPPASIREMIVDFKREQAAYARGFMSDLDNLTKDGALARAASYATAILHLSTRIATDDVPPLPVYPGDATLQCGPFCKCHLEIVPLGGGDYDIYWRLGAAEEHCDDCPILAQEWNPLPIRNGKIRTGDLGLPSRVKRREKAALTIIRAYLPRVS